MKKCKACGADIIYIPTYGGEMIPCDPDEVMYWQDRHGSNRVVTRNGEIIRCRLQGEPEKATGLGYAPHWSTCRHRIRR